MWDTFGLQKNPFDIKAVETYGIIPTSTFIGRDAYRGDLKRMIQTRDHSLSLVVGEKGIGKTSLGNVVRSDLSGAYFISLSEIDTQSTWSSSDFIFNSLCNLYETAAMAGTYAALPKKYLDACKSINAELKPLFEDESSSIGVQAAGFGFEKGSGKGLTTHATAFLKLKTKRIVEIISQAGYSGIIFQFNNLDNIEDERRLSRVLADLRDFLLTDKCHFIFLGNKTMESCFKSNSKINECISCEIQLGPLAYYEIKAILAKRYDAFKIPGRSPLAPVHDDALDVVYGLFEGNIRQIFYALDMAAVNSQKVIGRTEQLRAPAIKSILFTLAKERINSELQPRAFDVLLYALRKKGEITNTEITRKLKLKAQNTSKYLGQLKANNLIVAMNREGRNIYYKTVNEARWLLLAPEKGKQKTLEYDGVF